MFNLVGRPGLPKQRRWIPKAHHQPHQSFHECARRLNQVDEGKLSVVEIKITPRRPNDFTGKDWRHLNAKRK